MALSALYVLFGFLAVAFSASDTRSRTPAGMSTFSSSYKEGSFRFSDVDVYFKMYDVQDSDAPVALFLHGARFTKDNWMQLGTLQVLRSSGWRAIAIDLPGHGDTQKLAYGDNNMRAELIEAAFRFAGQGHRFLVSPSMSGKYALPYLDRYGASLLGWVALAPVGVLSWGGPGEVAHKRVRLLAMYGVRDPMVKEADRLQRMFLHEQKEVLPFAGHACYMDNTQAFHTVLQKFILSTLMDAHHEKLRKPHELDTL